MTVTVTHILQQELLTRMPPCMVESVSRCYAVVQTQIMPLASLGRHSVSGAVRGLLQVNTGVHDVARFMLSYYIIDISCVELLSNTKLKANRA
jgi:hypothetical protein